MNFTQYVGEMEPVGGKFGVHGQVAYVPQQPWIQNQNVRNNITLGTPFDEYFYGRVMSACCLYPDMQILSMGDLTEIGEKVRSSYVSLTSSFLLRVLTSRVGKSLALAWPARSIKTATSICWTIPYRPSTVMWAPNFFLTLSAQKEYCEGNKRTQ